MRELGATGEVTASAYEENGFIALRIHLEGFAPAGKDDHNFSDHDENVLTGTEQLRDMLFKYQDKVVLSVVVTCERQNWKFRPAKKDGKLFASRSTPHFVGFESFEL